MIQRFRKFIEVLGIFLFTIVIALPCFFLLFVSSFVMLLFIPFDLPIWILTGKAPVTWTYLRLTDILDKGM